MKSNTMIRTLAGVGILFAAATAQAENPGSGTLTIHEQVIEYSEGPNIGYNITPFAGGGDTVTCNEALPCDHFALTVDLPEDIGAVYPSATVRITVSWDDITGAGAEDYDLYLRDSAGNIVGDAASDQMPEIIVELANGGITERVLDVVYFANVASTYTAKFELVLGEPAEGADLDAFFGNGEGEGEGEGEGGADGLVGSLVGEQAEPRAAETRAPANAGGGSLGLAVLALGLAGFGRRRR